MAALPEERNSPATADPRAPEVAERVVSMCHHAAIERSLARRQAAGKQDELL